ncbi:MAG TPA: DASS family sodium-coupled anion symporter [Planctomycetota bacterium]|nr:DASS family sodium-coupled anion symporter [Planctomycetota bacterium]
MAASGDGSGVTEGADRESPRGFRLPPFLAGVGLGLAAWFLAGSLPGTQRATAAITATTTAWWIGGAMPLGAASLFPFAALPLSGAMPVSAVAAAYFDPILLLFFGGFLLAFGFERWGLHRRLAYGIVRRVGAGPRRLVLGLMVATAFVSMWVSNTATALLMFPIALAVVGALEEAGSGGDRNFAFAALLGVGYAASIGGVGTPVGTAPNMVFLGQYRAFFPEAPPISFARWMEACVPLVAVLLVAAWACLVLAAPPRPADPRAAALLQDRARSLGPWTVAEKRMGALFLLAALAWIFRQPIDLGGGWRAPGWSEFLPDAKAVDDAVVAVAVAFLAFLVPSGTGKGRSLLDWETAARVPWDILLLLGAGFAIAKAFEASGFSRTVGDLLLPLLRGAPPLLLVAGICAFVTFLSEFASNTATAQFMMPVLRGVAAAASLDPLLLLLPAGLAASCGFMLPIATPPNAIVFASGRIPVRRMLRVGLLVDLLGIVAITTLVFTLGGAVFGIRFEGVPSWAGSTPR